MSLCLNCIGGFVEDEEGNVKPCAYCGAPPPPPARCPLCLARPLAERCLRFFTCAAYREACGL